MGGGDKTKIKQMIQTELSFKISQTQETLNNIVNETMTNLSTSMVNQTAAQIEQATTASNTASLGTLIATDGAQISIEQQAKMQAVNDAIVKILSDSSALADLGSKTAQEVQAKLQQDAGLKGALETVAKASESSKEGGGPEGMLNKLADTASGIFGSLTGSKSEKDIETEIRQKISMEIENRTLTQTNIVDKTATTITTEIKNSSEGSCRSLNSANNLLELEKAIASGQGSKINIFQLATVDAFNKCLVDLNIGGKIMNQIADESLLKLANDTTQTAKAEAEAKASAEQSKEQVQESGIMKSVDNVVDTAGGVIQKGLSVLQTGYIGVILIVILVVGGGIYLISSGVIDVNSILGTTKKGKKASSGKSKKSSSSKSNKSGKSSSSKSGKSSSSKSGKTLKKKSKGQKGGNYNIKDNIYIILAIIAFFMYLFRVSVPMCGFVLIMFIVYILTITPENKTIIESSINQLDNVMI